MVPGGEGLAVSDTLPVSPWDLFIAVWTVIGMASAEELK